MTSFVTSFQTAEALNEALRKVDSALGMGAITQAWTAFDRANYNIPDDYIHVSNTKISVTYSNGDAATLYGSNLMGNTRNISRLDYKFQDGTEVSLKGAVTSTTSHSPTGNITQLTISKAGYGTTTFYGNSDVSGKSIHISKKVTDIDGVHYEANGTTTGYLWTSGGSYRAWHETLTDSSTISMSGQSATISGANYQTNSKTPYTSPETTMRTLLAGNDTLIASGAEAMLTGYGGNDTLQGSTGIDTANYHGARASYTITKTAEGYRLTDTRGTERTDTLKNIERLKFYDHKVALDLDPAHGKAAQTAKILGAVFGADAITNKQYVGIGLSLLDSGMSYAELMKLALDARLGSGFSNADEVHLLYTHLVGTGPSAEDLDYWVNAIQSGQFTQTTLGILAADLELNQSNINLIGLANTGLDYV